MFKSNSSSGTTVFLRTIQGSWMQVSGVQNIGPEWTRSVTSLPRLTVIEKMKKLCTTCKLPLFMIELHQWISRVRFLLHIAKWDPVTRIKFSDTQYLYQYFWRTLNGVERKELSSGSFHQNSSLPMHDAIIFALVTEPFTRIARLMASTPWLVIILDRRWNISLVDSSARWGEKDKGQQERSDYDF